MGEGIRKPALEALEGEGEADSSRDSQGAGDSSLLTRGVRGGGRGRPGDQCLRRHPTPGFIKGAGM